MVDSSNHFFKFIKPSSKFNVSIPRSFWTKLKDTRCKQAILKRGRHEWPVEISDDGAFCDGWKEFVKDNGVQEFDFIVFEHNGNYVFDFMVFDQSMCEKEYPSNLFDEMDVEEPLIESDSTHIYERSKVVKKRKRNKTSSKNEDKLPLDDDRCFTVIMTPYIIKSYRLHVPASFVRSKGLLTRRRRTQAVLTDEAQRTWQATLHISRFRLGVVGLREFLKKNDLKVGDECTFELVKQGKVPVFNVVIRKKKKQKTLSTLQKETGTTINNDYRYFISTLKLSSLTKSGLYVPLEFSKQNGLKLGEVVLRDDKGRSWKAQLNKTGENAFCLGCGVLKDFCYANGLREGDTLKFEIIENEKDKPPVMNISLNVNSIPSKTEDLPYFISQVKASYLRNSMLYLPSKFTKKSGLFDKDEMILKNVKDDKLWTVELDSTTSKYRYIARGWKEFCVANRLKDGDVFKLELVCNGEIPIANFYFL